MPTLFPTRPKRIHLLGDGRHEEGVAAGVITPGDLVALNSDGAYVRHASGGGRAETNFALEDALQGRTIDDNYAAASPVSFVCAEQSDVVFARLAAGETVTPADFLTSNGDGTLKKAGGSDNAVAVPLESIDNSDSGAVDVRIRVRVI